MYPILINSAFAVARIASIVEFLTSGFSDFSGVIGQKTEHLLFIRCSFNLSMINGLLRLTLVLVFVVFFIIFHPFKSAY